jgi:hypothetical protein
MNASALTPSRRAAVAAAAVVAAGLALAACGGSSSSGGSNAGAGSAGSSSKPASSQSSSTSGSTSAVSTNSVPFPVGVGNTWTYSTSDAAGTTGTVVDKMAAVSPVSGGQQVTMDNTSTILGTTTTNTAYYVFHSDGSVSLPFSQFNTSSSSSSSDVKLISGTLAWPSASALASGASSNSTLQISFSINGQSENVTADITVKGAGTQSVTVPAGTYNATVVDMTMSETVEGIPVSSTVTTWLAPGVGPVKSQVMLNEDGHETVAATQVLTSFVQG